MAGLHWLMQHAMSKQQLRQLAALATQLENELHALYRKADLSNMQSEMLAIDALSVALASIKNRLYFSRDGFLRQT